jgi:hypothetical protein
MKISEINTKNRKKLYSLGHDSKGKVVLVPLLLVSVNPVKVSFRGKVYIPSETDPFYYPNKEVATSAVRKYAGQLISYLKDCKLEQERRIQEFNKRVPTPRKRKKEASQGKKLRQTGISVKPEILAK